MKKASGNRLFLLLRLIPQSLAVIVDGLLVLCQDVKSGGWIEQMVWGDEGGICGSVIGI